LRRSQPGRRRAAHAAAGPAEGPANRGVDQAAPAGALRARRHTRIGGAVHLLDWHALMVNLFAFGASDLTVSLLEKILRPVAIYLFLVIALRAVGKRILAQLNPFDLVVLLTLSNTVQNAIIGNDTSLSGGVIGAVALLGINTILVRLYYRGPTIEQRLIEEDDVYLIRDHQLQHDQLRRLHINVGELTARAHERGFDDIHEVESAVLYPNGTIYMKGGDSRDAARITEILQQLQALRQDVATLRR
jgi:uncharacterized membrane protein YcaP (DUF421 family)